MTKISISDIFKLQIGHTKMKIKKQKIFLLNIVRFCAFLFLLYQIPSLFSIFKVDAASNYEELYNKKCSHGQCDFHGGTYYENRNGFIYDKNTNEKTDGVLAENFSTLGTITSLINSGRDFYYSYRDGIEEDHLMLRSLYSSTNPDEGQTVPCRDPAFCDNLELNDSKKLNLQFNLSLQKSYTDVRVNINYLSLNKPGRAEINVVDYDSLRLYIFDASGNQYGPFKIENTEYLGVLKRKTQDVDDGYVDLYEDNYNLYSENLLKDPVLKTLCQNGCDLRVKIVPFDTYHNENAYFNLKSISVNDYQEAYKKESVAEMNAANDLKLGIVNRMFGNALIKYRPSQDFALNGNSITGNKAFKSTYIYYGQPYVGRKVGSKEEFTSRISNGVYDASGEINSFSCSTSTLDAVATNIPEVSNLDWTGEYFFNPEVSIVECLSGSSCASIDRYTLTGKTATEIRTELNQDQMYSRYANLHYGDVLAHKEVCTNLTLCGASGHTILVTDDPVVVYDNSGKIDGAKSYVFTTEILDGDVSKAIGQDSYISTIGMSDESNSGSAEDIGSDYLDLTQPNIANYLASNNTSIEEYRGGRTQWRLSKKYSFDQLFNGEKITAETRTEHVYIPFTFNVYKDIASSGKIEKPYVKFIYDGLEFQNYYDSATNFDNNQKFADAVINAEQMVGTIWSNYKITDLQFKVGLENDTVITKTIYPAYIQNNPENRISFYYDDMMEEINSMINGNIKSLKVSATAGNRVVKIVDWARPNDPGEPGDEEVLPPDTGRIQETEKNSTTSNYYLIVASVAILICIAYKKARGCKKIKFDKK